MMIRRLLTALPPWTLTIVVSALIIYLTLVPKPLPETDIPMFPGADKLVHAIMFGALAGAIGLDSVRRNGMAVLSNMYLAVIAVITTMSGGLIEILQYVMAMGRGCELWDFVADGVGASAAVFIVKPISRKLLIGKAGGDSHCDDCDE